MVLRSGGSAAADTRARAVDQTTVPASSVRASPRTRPRRDGGIRRMTAFIFIRPRMIKTSGVLSSNLAEDADELAQGGSGSPEAIPESAPGGEALTALLDRWADGDPRAF